MSPDVEPITPQSVIATRVKQARQEKRLTAQQLGDAMVTAGFKWDRFVVQNLEKGKRKSVSVEELLALALILEVALVHLIVPIDDEETPFLVTPNGPAVLPAEARAWIRGLGAIGDVDPRRYRSQVPRREADFDITGAMTPALIAKLNERQTEIDRWNAEHAKGGDGDGR